VLNVHLFQFTDAGWNMNLNGVQLTKDNLKLCKGEVACGTCEYDMMKTFIDSTSEATVMEVVGYVNDNMRWLGKYKSRDDKLVQ